MAILAYNKPVFQPARRIIVNMASAPAGDLAQFGVLVPATIITLSLNGVDPFDNDYILGTIVRLVVPNGYGMVQADGQTGTIILLGSNAAIAEPSLIAIDLDSTMYDPFIVPDTYPVDYQYAQIIPIGEVNNTLRAATQNVLPYPAN